MTMNRILMSFLFFFPILLLSQGTMDFENTTLTASYSDGSFIEDGITYTYGHSRNQDTYPITDKGLLLRRASDSYLEWTIPNGIGNLAFQYRKAYAGGDPRNLEVSINGIVAGTTGVFGGTNDEDPTIHNFSYNINLAGSVTVKIKNVGATSTSRHSVIDNIIWTAYDSDDLVNCIEELEFPSLPTGWTTSGTQIPSSTNNEIGFNSQEGYVVLSPVSNPQTITFDLRRTSDTNAKALNVEVSTSLGGTYTLVDTYDHSNTNSNSTTLVQVDLSAYSFEPVVYIRLRKISNTTSPWYVKNIIVNCGLCNPELSVVEVRPETAPVLASVQIEVNQSDLIDIVHWEDAPILFDVINATTISINVPFTAHSGENQLVLFEEGGCEIEIDYTVLTHSGTCTDPENFDGIDLTSPFDAFGCNIDLSVFSSTSGPTYQWYYNAPYSMAEWNEVNTTNLPGYTISGQTSEHLLISGDTESLNNYQFYCEATNGSCGKISNVAKYNFDGKMYYRSVNSGDWTTISNWEVAKEMLGQWIPACNYPNETNAYKVIIENGTELFLGINTTFNSLEIKSGGVLETGTDVIVEVNNENPNADFIVEGTFLFRSNKSMDFNNNATWILGNSGVFIKTNTSSTVVFRDHYEGGMSTIPASAQWIYRYNGDGTVVIATANMYYPNLRFENTTSSPYIANSSIGGSYFTAGSNNSIIKGDLEVGTTGSSTFKMFNNVTSGPMLIQGDLRIGSGSALSNEKAVPSSIAGAGFSVEGDVVVDGTLDLSYGSGERVLTFIGENIQTVSGAGIINIHKIEINKNNNDVILNRDIQAKGELKMVSGNIVTQANLIELGVDLANKGVLSHTNGYVVGKMKRWFSGINSTDATGLFPLGWDGNDPLPNGFGIKNRFAKIQFTTAPSSGGSITAEFTPQDMTANGLPIPAANSGGFGDEINNAEDQGFWRLLAGDGLTAGIYTASLTGEGFTEIVDLNDLTMLKRTDGNSPWFAPGQHILATGTTSKPTVHRSNLTDFSDFGFGSSNLNNPLPIELLSFEVECNENEVVISWSTASETDNERFIVEKLYENIDDWRIVAEVKGAGNSSTTKSYQLVDNQNRNNEVEYYRLTQVDFDGTETVYPTKSIVCESKSQLLIYPNPASSTLFIQGDFLTKGTVIKLYDMQGHEVASYPILSSSQTKNLIHLTGLAKGIYLISVIQPTGEKKNRKLVIN